MFIEPNSHIKIYRNIESSGKRRPIFKTAAAQSAYFASHLAFDYTPTTHVKYTMNKVRVGLSVAQLLGCNYLSFVNPSYGNKVYYAQILGDPVYINNECTELTYAVDYCQTDMFNVTLEPCYIDREHLSDEDFEKSIRNPYDTSIKEFWTSEPLPMTKDIERDYDVEEDTQKAILVARKKWKGTEDYNKMITIVAFSPVTPPNSTEEDWYRYMLSYMFSTDSHYGMSFVYSTTDIDSNHSAGEVWCSAKLQDIIGTHNPKFQSNFSRPYNIVAMENNAGLFGDNGILDHFTLWGATDSILAIHSLPAYMVFEMFRPTDIDDAVVSIKPLTSAVELLTAHNTKLFRYPYRYLRAIAPNGDTKEFQFERSTDITEGTYVGIDPPKFYFDIVTDYNSQPIVSLIPMNYKMKTPGNTVFVSDAFKPNVYERLDFSSVPQVPYTTDAFLAGLAAANADILASRTVENENQLLHTKNQLDYSANDIMIQGYRHGFQTIDDIVNILGTSASATDTLSLEGVTRQGTAQYSYDPTGIYGAAMNAANKMLDIAQRQNNIDRSLDSLAYNRNKVGLQQNMMEDSANLSLNALEQNNVYHNIAKTKPLYVSDKYVPSVGTGTYFYNDACVMDFILLVVMLRSDIMAKYDQWFSNYGYSQGIFAQPKIMKYISNAETGKPHFAPSGGMNVTYIKTSGAAVKAPSKTSETFWEAMLDGGVQFIKGEELT